MIYAVISEFNPFHSGHQWLLEQIPCTQEDYTVCIMSGSFVQRGEPAAYDKWSRAQAAVQGGADAVVELPVPFVLSDGEGFAAKGVELAAAFGMPVTMVFGIEAKDTAALEKLAAVDEEELSPVMKSFLEAGLSYGAARQAALEQLLPEESKALRSPNNLLACGYIRACLRHGLSYLGIQRKVPHDGAPQGNVASASYIRAHQDEFSKYCPFGQDPALNLAAAEQGIFTLLKTKTAQQLQQSANIGEGLENRMVKALFETEGLQAFYDRVKTKRYAHAKLRRAAVSAVLEIPAGMPREAVPYIRVLAFGERGKALLRSLRKNATLPICQSGRECEGANPAFFARERLATDLWNCWSKHPLPSGEDYRRGAIAVNLE